MQQSLQRCKQAEVSAADNWFRAIGNSVTSIMILNMKAVIATTVTFNTSDLNAIDIISAVTHLRVVARKSKMTHQLTS